MGARKTCRRATSTVHIYSTHVSHNHLRKIFHQDEELHHQMEHLAGYTESNALSCPPPQVSIQRGGRRRDIPRRDRLEWRVADAPVAAAHKDHADL